MMCVKFPIGTDAAWELQPRIGTYLGWLMMTIVELIFIVYINILSNNRLIGGHNIATKNE